MILTCSGTHKLVVNIGDEQITVDGRSFPMRTTESRSKRRLEMTNDQGLTFSRYPERTSPDGFHHQLDMNGGARSTRTAWPNRTANVGVSEEFCLSRRSRL